MVARIGAGQPTLGQLGERGQGGRVEVVEQVADLVADLLTGPHRVLAGRGQHPDRLGQLGVGGQRPVRGSIGAHNVGQQHRVGGIGFGPRHRIPGPIPRGGQRVDRIDHPGRWRAARPPTIRDRFRSPPGSGARRCRRPGPTASATARSRPRRCRPALAPPHARRRRPQRHRDVLWPNQFHNTGAGIITPSIVVSSTNLGGSRGAQSQDSTVRHLTGRP